MKKIKDISNVKNKKLKELGMFQVFFNTRIYTAGKRIKVDEFFIFRSIFDQN